MRATSLIRTYGLAIYWLAFAAYTIYVAQFPGLIAHPELWSHPWRAVLVVWALLGILIGVLHLILRPATYRYSWARLIGALIYSAVLLTLGILSVVTDMPGYYYVPAMFSVVTFGLLLVFALVQTGFSLIRKGSHAA
jgi:hypothetical protein